MSRIPWGYRIGAAVCFLVPLFSSDWDAPLVAGVMGAIAALFILLFAYEAHK